MSDDVELCACKQPIADCLHLGIFSSYEEKALFYRQKPERVAAMQRLDALAKKAGELQQLLEAADLAHDVGHVAEDLGASLPYRGQVIETVDAVKTFGPMAKNLPVISKNPVASQLVDLLVTVAKLLLRAITGK